MKISFVGIEGNASGTLAGERQALTAYASSDSPSVPQAMGGVRCDTDGNAVLGRTLHNSSDDAASATPAEALPAYAKRVRLHLQNKSSTITLRYTWGTDPTVFELDPRETLTLTGDDCPADSLNVSTASSTATYAAADW